MFFSGNSHYETNFRNHTRTLPLQRGGNKISGLPLLQGAIKWGKTNLWVHLSLGGEFKSSPKRKKSKAFLSFGVYIITKIMRFTAVFDQTNYKKTFDSIALQCCQKFSWFGFERTAL